MNITPCPTALAAAKEGQLLRAYTRSSSWIESYHHLFPFSSSGPHKSLHPTYPVGTPLYLPHSELERALEKSLSPTTNTRKVAQQILHPNTPLSPSLHPSPSPLQLPNEKYWSKSQLLELRQLLPNAQRLLLDSLLSRRSFWISENTLLQTINPFTTPELARWQRNNDPFVALHELSPPHLSAYLPEKEASTLIGLLRFRVAQREDLHPRFSAVLKCGVEARYEFLPAALARLLNLEKSLVPSKAVRFSHCSLIGAPQQDSSWNANIQPYIPHGTKVSTLLANNAKRLSLIPLRELQEAALFAALTQQADLHANNAYVVEDPTDTPHLALFDIGRSCYPNTPFRKKPNEEHSLLLNSFFLAIPQLDTPLEPSVCAKIRSWDCKKTLSNLTEDPHLSRTIETLPLLSSRHKIQRWEQTLRSHVTPQQKSAFEQKIKKLQHLIKTTPSPTLRDAYEALLPNEMLFLFDLFSVVYEGKSLPKGTTIESALHDGETRGILSPEEATVWRLHLIQCKKQHPPVHHWTYPHSPNHSFPKA